MSKRIKWLDFAKGITILDVILIHTAAKSMYFPASSIAHYIIQFINFMTCIPAMPIFFAISGYLYKPTRNWSSFKIMCYKKITSFVIPYVVFSLIIVIYSNFNNFNHWNYFNPISYLWFLYALFFIFMIVGILDLLHVNLYFQLIIACICFLWSMKIPYLTNNNYQFNPLVCIGGYLICFYIGYLIKRLAIIRFLSNCNLSYSLFIFWLILMLLQIHFYGYNYAFDLFRYQDWIVKLLSIPVFFSLFSICNQQTKFFMYFDKYGKCTLIIYLIHFPGILIISYLLRKISLSCIPSFLILTLFGWYISVFICKLSSKFHIINFVFYPRKYINKLISKG